MTELLFDFDWTDPLEARGPELRATWARLSIRVGGRTPSRVFDQTARTVRDSIYLPLYPLAEWLAANWWRVLFEMESPERTKDELYPQRHNLRWAREGYSVPSMSLTPVGDSLQLRWEPELLPYHRVEFIEWGSALVGLESAQRSLQNLITGVVSRLIECGVEGTFLQREWNVIANTSGDEGEFCIAAATLGLDPYDIDEVAAAAIIAAAELIPTSIRREFFGVANRERLGDETRDVTAAIATARNNGSDLRRLQTFRECIAPSRSRNGHAPWEIGYAAARELRKALGIGIQPVRSLSDLARALRVASSDLTSAITEQPAGDHAYEAVVATNRNSGPAFAVTPRSESASRFQICRGLYEYLSGRDDGPWIVTTSLSDRQKRNRAFAAEFLAPAAGIQERVSSPIVSSKEVDDISLHFGVSSDAIVHQMTNHGIARVGW
jgi:hypothetical protein